MEQISSRLDFQINRLGYQFQNVDLLTEAVTHSGQSFKQNYDRLGALGESVLKLVVSDYVLKAVEIKAGNPSGLKDKLLSTKLQNEIGRKLFSKPNVEKVVKAKDLLCFIVVDSGNWYNEGFELPYHKLLKGIFGAVFTDAGCSAKLGLQKCCKLFAKLWKPSLQPGRIKKLEDCFPTPHHLIKQFWIKNGITLKFIQNLEKRLIVSFKHRDTICEALIQKSYYDPIRNDPPILKLHQPDYERLEFLGDSVLGLVIAEHIFSQNPTANSTEIVSKCTPLITDEHQRRIYHKLKLGDFVKMKKDRIKGWDKQGDIVESVIGAIFVDGGLVKAKEFVLKHWKLTGKILSMGNLESKLGYRFNSQKNLEDALEFTEIDPEIDLPWGLLKLLAADYAVRQIFGENVSSLERLQCAQNRVLEKPVLEEISKYLDLPKLVKNKGERCSNWEILLKVLNAIWEDCGTTCKGISRLLSLFYRLWNPYLKQISDQPIAQLLLQENKENENATRFLCNPTSFSLIRKELLGPILSKESIEASVKLEFIGENLMSLLRWMGVLVMEHAEPESDIKRRFVNHIAKSFKVDLILEHWEEESLELAKTKLMYRVLGAVYVDMDNTTDKTLWGFLCSRIS